MNNDQKLLLIGGAALVIISAVYIAMSNVPDSRSTAILFPLSILGLLFGIVFVVWGLSWMLLARTRVLK